MDQKNSIDKLHENLISIEATWREREKKNKRENNGKKGATSTGQEVLRNLVNSAHFYSGDQPVN